MATRTVFISTNEQYLQWKSSTSVGRRKTLIFHRHITRAEKNNLGYKSVNAKRHLKIDGYGKRPTSDTSFAIKAK